MNKNLAIICGVWNENTEKNIKKYLDYCDDYDVIISSDKHRETELISEQISVPLGDHYSYKCLEWAQQVKSEREIKNLRSYEDCNLYNTTVQNMITTHDLTDCFRSPDYVRPEVNEVSESPFDHDDEGQIERVRVDDPWDHEEIAQQCRVGSPEEKADPVVDFFNNPNPDEDIPF